MEEAIEPKKAEGEKIPEGKNKPEELEKDSEQSEVPVLEPEPEPLPKPEPELAPEPEPTLSPEDETIKTAKESWDKWAPVQRLEFLEWLDIEHSISCGRLSREKVSGFDSREMKLQILNCQETINISKQILKKTIGQRSDLTLELSRVSAFLSLLEGVRSAFESIENKTKQKLRTFMDDEGNLVQPIKMADEIFREKEKIEIEKSQSQLKRWSDQNKYGFSEVFLHRLVTLVRRFYWNGKECTDLAKYINRGLSRQKFVLGNGEKINGFEICSVIPEKELVLLPFKPADHVQSPVALINKADLKDMEIVKPDIPKDALRKILLGLVKENNDGRELFLDSILESIAIARQQLGAYEQATQGKVEIWMEQRLAEIESRIEQNKVNEAVESVFPFLEKHAWSKVFLDEDLKYSRQVSLDVIGLIIQNHDVPISFLKKLLLLDELTKSMPPWEHFSKQGIEACEYQFEGKNVSSFPVPGVKDWFCVYGSGNPKLVHLSRLAQTAKPAEDKTFVIDKCYFLKTFKRLYESDFEAAEKDCQVLVEFLGKNIYPGKSQET